MRFSLTVAATLLLAVFGLAGCVVSLPAPNAAPTAPATASQACRNTLAGTWTVAVQIDRPDGSALALISGDDIATCVASRNTDGAGFGSTAVGEGRHPLSSPPALTYVSGMSFPSAPPVLVGRLPPGTTMVRLVFADGSQEMATIGGNIWLAWLQATREPVRIEALDDSGASISHLEDVNGIEPAD